MTRKITIIHKGGSAHTWAIDLLEGFVDAGHKPELISLRERNYEERLVESREKLKYYQNPVTIERIAARIRHHRPHLILLLNAISLPSQAHEKIRTAAGSGVPIISWLADHFQTFPENTEPNLDAIHYFDSATLPLLEANYRSTADLRFLPLAVNPRRFSDHGISWEKRKPGLVFIGNHTLHRLDWIEQIRKDGLGVSCYGPRAPVNFRLWRKRKLTPLQSAKLYGNHQAALNLLQPPNTIHGLNLRAYEIPASGGLGTYPHTPDLEKSFVPGEEVLSFANPSDLIGQINSLSAQKAALILKQAAAKMREHTYRVRAEQLVRLI